MYLKDDNFLHYLAYGKDNKQKCNIIKYTTNVQLKILKSFASDILKGSISLKKFQLDYLKKSKEFIRKLSKGKVKNRELTKHYKIVCYIIKISLENDEKHTEISTRSDRKMGKNRGQRGNERNYCEESSSEESFTSDEYSSTSEDSEKSEGFREEDKSENNSDVSFSLSEE